MTEPSVAIEPRVHEPENLPADRSRGLPLADREAFTAAFRQFYAPLIRYARRFTGDASTAADVLQDVFTRLWERRNHLTVQVSLQALLYTMVRNRALNLCRGQRRIADGVDLQEILDRDPLDPAGEGALQAEHLQRLLHRWIDDLPPRRREAFVLSRYHGLSHREIAAVMEVSERTVDTHILLALRTLRDRLDDLHTEGTAP